jgi:hypothetical protein
MINSISKTSGKIFVFGTGSAARRVTAYLTLRGVKVVGYLDNNSEKWGLCFLSKPIHSPAILTEEQGGVVYIASQFYKTILLQLKRMRLERLVLIIPPRMVLFGPFWVLTYAVNSARIYLKSAYYTERHAIFFHIEQLRVIKCLRAKKVVVGSNLKLVRKIRSVLKAKDTSTAYILGCGTSINNLSDHDFSRISRGLSIGLNGFIYHKFDTDINSFEFDDTSIPSDFRTELYHYFRDRRTGYGGQVTIFKDMHRIDHEALRKISSASKQLYAAGVIYLTTFGFINAKFYRSALYKFFCLLRRSAYGIFPVLFQRTNSLDYVVDLLIASGVKRIILCGVDLDQNGYFWEEDPPVENFFMGRRPIYAKRCKGVNYLMNTRINMGVDVSEVLLQLKDGDRFYGFDGIHLINSRGGLANILDSKL